MSVHLVPFCELRCYSSQGDLLYTFATGDRVDSYQLENLLGVTNAEVKLAGSSASIEATIPISEELVRQADTGKGPLFQTLNLDNYWRIDFGWGGGTEPNSKTTVSRMKLFGFRVDYDPQIRGYNMVLTLSPAYSLVLGEMNIKLCKKTLKMVRDYKAKHTGIFGTPENQTDYVTDPRFRATELSVGNIINSLLEESRTIIEQLQGQRDLFLDRSRLTIDDLDFTPKPGGGRRMEKPLMSKAAAYELSPFFSAKADNTITNQESYYNEIDYGLKDYVHSIRLLLARKDDVPHASRIVMTVLGQSERDCDNVATAMWADPPVSWNTLDKLADEDQTKTMSVYAFIVSLLDDHGFTLIQQPGIIDFKTGAMSWMIIPSTYSNVGDRVEEEYMGIIDPGPMVNDRPANLISINDKVINTITGDRNGVFDLQSRNNVILSMQGSTSNGETNMLTATAAQLAVKKRDDSIPTGSQMEVYRETMYQFVAFMSKKVTLETVGIPRLKPFDTMKLRMVGQLFTGAYKILEVSHRIGGGFTTTVEMTQLVEDTGDGATLKPRPKEKEKREGDIVPSDLKPVADAAKNSRTYIPWAGGDYGGKL